VMIKLNQLPDNSRDETNKKRQKCFITSNRK
jgi:hypothetical protein